MKRKEFSKQFEQEAVKALEAGDKSPSTLARELGIRRNQLYKWQKQIHLKGEAAFPGQGRQGVERLSEVERLRQRVAELEEENQILKKAESYFTVNRE